MKNILLDLPFSRKCESEADYIGLLLMSKSCYDPEEAIKLWQRMSDKTKNDAELFSLFSTHPSHEKRIENLRTWMPKAQRIYSETECSDFLFNHFNKAYKNFD